MVKFDKTITDAQFKIRIISALRQLSRWWWPKNECINKARVRRGVYKCEICWKEWPKTLPAPAWKTKRINNILADHIEPVVDTKKWWVSYDEFIKRCFVWVEWFQALCNECHKKKTSEEREERKKFKTK